MSKKTYSEFKLAPVAAALVLAFGSAYAQQTPEVMELITPESTLSVGVGGVSNLRDAKRFGQYTGLNNNASALVDFEKVTRDDATGTWTKLTGRDLGLDTRELNYSRQKQGDWKYSLDYNEIVRNDPYVINTGMTGIGSANPIINLIANPIATPAVVGTGGWGAITTTPNTVVTGAALTTANLASPNGFTASNGIAGRDVELKLKRTALGLSGEKWLSSEVQMELSFRTEDKKGARMFGRVGLGSSDMKYSPAKTATDSLNGGWAMLLTPEPIDSNIHQIEAKLNFNRDKLALTAGYYGSFYVNNNGNLSPIINGNALNRGTLWAASGTGATLSASVKELAQSAVALPPDNQAHQVYVSGTYALSDTTRTNFKLALTHATQDESFVGMGLTPAVNAPASLGGVVDTTLAQVGLSMRPSKNLSVNASLRYEDRQDKTPVYVYNTNGVLPPTTVDPLNPLVGNALNGSTNWASGSQTRTSAKVDGIYRLPDGYSVSLGADWENKKTPLPPSNTALFSGQVLVRDSLDEYGVHAGLRKAMSETLNGGLSLEYKQRHGGDWYMTSGNIGNALVLFDPTSSSAMACSTSSSTNKVTCSTLANKVLPDMYMDRDRTKLRGNLDWDPSDKLSLQAAIEFGLDNYNRGNFPTVVSGASGATGTDAAKLAAALAALAATQVVPTTPGARVISNNSLTLDGSYKVSDDWRLTGYWTHSENRWNVNKANLGDDTNNTVDTFGIGIKGKVNPRLSVGMDLLVANDVTTFNNVVATPVTGQAAGNIVGFTTAVPGNYLPKITYNTTKLNLFGIYELDKKSAIKVNVVYQEFKNDDWQWGYNGVPFLYSDNTTVSNPNQAMTFLGVSYQLKF